MILNPLFYIRNGQSKHLFDNRAPNIRKIKILSANFENPLFISNSKLKMPWASDCFKNSSDKHVKFARFDSNYCFDSAKLRKKTPHAEEGGIMPPRCHHEASESPDNFSAKILIPGVELRNLSPQNDIKIVWNMERCLKLVRDDS